LGDQKSRSLEWSGHLDKRCFRCRTSGNRPSRSPECLQVPIGTHTNIETAAASEFLSLASHGNPTGIPGDALSAVPLAERQSSEAAAARWAEALRETKLAAAVCCSASHVNLPRPKRRRPAAGPTACSG